MIFVLDGVKNMVRSHRVFLGVKEIAGIMLKLHHAFDELGIDNQYLCFYEYPFAGESQKEYHSDDLNMYMKIVGHVRRCHVSKRVLFARMWQILEMFCVLAIFIKSLIRYDVFVFIFGKSLFSCNYYLKYIQEFEFKLYKFFGKKVIMWCCGSDTRPTYCDIFEGNVDELYSMTKKKAELVRMLEKYAIMIDSPSSSQFHTKPFVSVNTLGQPMEMNEMVRTDSDGNMKKIILHAPSAKRWKGTAEIRELVGKLQKEGHPIEYVEVSGSPHDVVMQKLRRADIVLDQLYSDIPIAMFAAEASINGTPPILCGYYSEICKEDTPGSIPPTVFIAKEELEKTLIDLIYDDSKREEIGKKCQKWIFDNCISTKVARKLLEIAEGTFDSKNLYYPQNSMYVWGMGQNKKDVIMKVVALVDKYGFEALCLNKSSKVYDSYLELYQNNKDDYKGVDWSNYTFK